MIAPVDRSCRALIPLLLVCLLPSCATGPRDLETPQGPRPADQVGPFVILGVVSRNTSTLHRSDARTTFSENHTVNVPPGTQLIIPAMRGWAIGYGSTTPDDLSQQPDINSTVTWHSADHHLGMAYLNIYVDRINAVDNTTTPATQTAVITVSGLLTDDNFDDGWWGTVNYTLLCLGVAPAR